MIRIDRLLDVEALTPTKTQRFIELLRKAQIDHTKDPLALDCLRLTQTEYRDFLELVDTCMNLRSGKLTRKEQERFLALQLNPTKARWYSSFSTRAKAHQEKAELDAIRAKTTR